MPQLAQAREIVGFSGAYSSGTVVVKTNERALYYVLGNGKAVRYPVGVGRIGKQWSGTAYISSKQLRPAWSPPAEVKRDKPSLPNVIPGGSPGNPMGAAALTLSGGGEYAIHGTNNPGSIGGFVSYGCIRITMRTCWTSITGSAGARRSSSPAERGQGRRSGVRRSAGSWPAAPDAYVERTGSAVADMGAPHAGNVAAEFRQQQPVWDLALEHAALA